MYSRARFLGAVPLAKRPMLSLGHLPYLGATGTEGYAQARAAVAKWDSLAARVQKLANAAAKQKVVTWMGSIGNEADPLYRYQTVANTVKAYAAETDPAKKAALYDGAEENRIEKLDAFNVQLEALVVEAEKLGVTSTPPPIAQVRPFPWVPVGIAAGAVALAVAVVAFSGSGK